MTRDEFYKETLTVLEGLLALPELVDLSVKDVPIAGMDDLASICFAIGKCYHDRYSDLDVTLTVKLNPAEHEREGPLYADCLGRLRFTDDVLGLHCEALPERGEIMRICKTNGMRCDLVIRAIASEEAEPLPHRGLSAEWVEANDFWFIAVQALGKLMRKDYLVASHLAHELVQMSLVQQMRMRDAEKGTRFHRHGYAEDLEYLQHWGGPRLECLGASDPVFAHIADLLYAGAASYERLSHRMSKAYQPRLEAFERIWREYMEG